jgi:NAD+ kinase
MRPIAIGTSGVILALVVQRPRTEDSKSLIVGSNPTQRTMTKKIIVVTKKTSYSKYILDQNDEETKLLISDNNPAVAQWISSHDSHMRTLDYVVNEIQKQNIVCYVIDSKSFVADPEDVTMVISVGGDGTLLSASHNVNGTLPILGVNSSPQTSVGFFCYSVLNTFLHNFTLALDSKCKETILTRMRVKKNGKVVCNRILNDVLFCHTNPAATSNYILQLVGYRPEVQRSSGLWVGPAAGSTAARRSAGATPMNLTSSDLQLRVRELYHRPLETLGQVELIATPEQVISVISKMDSSAMYLDGDYSIIPVGLGDKIHFEKSDESLHLVGEPNVLCD